MFWVINKSTNDVVVFNRAHDVAIWMLGRKLSNYIFIKSDETTDKLIVLVDGEFNAMIAELES